VGEGVEIGREGGEGGSGRLVVLRRAFAGCTGPRLGERDEREDPVFRSLKTSLDESRSSTSEVAPFADDESLVRRQRKEVRWAGFYTSIAELS
jgi:hypothetical protein